MKAVKRTRQFKKDIRLMQKQGKDLDILKQVIESLFESLIRGEKLEDRYYDHRLRGNFRNFRECHLEPDWGAGLSDLRHRTSDIRHRTSGS